MTKIIVIGCSESQKEEINKLLIEKYNKEIEVSFLNRDEIPNTTDEILVVINKNQIKINEPIDIKLIKPIQSYIPHTENFEKRIKNNQEKWRRKHFK